MTALENVGLPLVLGGVPPAERLARAADALLELRGSDATACSRRLASSLASSTLVPANNEAC